jgi:AcrR family transcriptional regulator
MVARQGWRLAITGGTLPYPAAGWIWDTGMPKTKTREPEGDVSSPSPAERILAAAFEAFVEHGYSEASTIEIATRAKVSKRDIYALFGNKHGVLKACITARARRLDPPQPQTTPTTREALESALTLLGARVFQELTSPTVVSVMRLGVAEADRAPEVAAELEAVRRKIHESVADLVGRAQTAGTVVAGKPTDLASDFMGLLMNDTLLRLMRGAIITPAPRAVRARALHAASAFIRLYGAP